MELLHISKAGGTSMCQLAHDAGLQNPYANMDANCLVSDRVGPHARACWHMDANSLIRGQLVGKVRDGQALLSQRPQTFLELPHFPSSIAPAGSALPRRPQVGPIGTQHETHGQQVRGVGARLEPSTKRTVSR